MNKNIEKILAEAFGEVSMCWSETPKGIFDSTAVSKILDRVLKELQPDTVQKTLTNTTASQAKDNVKDIVFWGDGNTFKLISKASSVNEGWMKSTKAMEIENVGCVVQVTTQQGDNVSEALTFVPGVKLSESTTAEQVGTVTSRKLIKF
jgi:hypothetical protein